MIVSVKAKAVAERLGQSLGTKPRSSRTTFLGDEESYSYVVLKRGIGARQFQKAYIGEQFWNLQIQNFEVKLDFALSFNQPCRFAFHLNRYSNVPVVAGYCVYCHPTESAVEGVTMGNLVGNASLVGLPELAECLAKLRLDGPEMVYFTSRCVMGRFLNRGAAEAGERLEAVKKMVSYVVEQSLTCRR